MGVYVQFPDGSMHWDESKADPNPNGGSVLTPSGGVVPGGNSQSGPTGPGGNGPTGSQANPTGGYHAGPSATTPGQTFGSANMPSMAGYGNPASTTSSVVPTNPAAPNPTPTLQTNPTGGTTTPGGFPNASQILGGYQFDPDDPAKAFRNALRSFGVPTSFLAAGQNSGMGKYLMNRSAQAYYQFLVDQAQSGGNLNSDAFNSYLGNFLGGGLRPATDMGSRLGYLRSLSDRLPTDVGNFNESSFSSPAEAALASLLMTQSGGDLTDLMLGQYGGAVSPGLIGSAMRPLANQQATQFEDTGAQLTGGKLFSTLRNFFLGH